MKARYLRKINEKLLELPWYVDEYVTTNKRTLSLTTLLNYCHDFIVFFNWLASEHRVAPQAKQIGLATLDTLTVRIAESFLTFLECNLGNGKHTMNRKLSSLKSLFNYLHNKAETKELKPYIQRNVMAKIELNALKESQETIANRIECRLLHKDEFEQFRQFIAYGYGEQNKKNKRIYHFHQFNWQRDTAIVSLILGSGLRLSEVAGIDIDDIQLGKGLVRVLRKGNKEQYVYFSKQALFDLQNYLNIRKQKYNPLKSEKFLFLSAPVGRKGMNRRLTQRSIEQLVRKYATAFGKPSLTVHALRHSFATRYHAENNDVPKLKNQLGHSSIQTTMIYTHLTNEDMKNAVQNMDK